MSVPTEFHSTLCRTYHTLCISVRQPITEVKVEWNVAADVWEIAGHPCFTNTCLVFTCYLPIQPRTCKCTETQKLLVVLLSILFVWSFLILILFWYLNCLICFKILFIYFIYFHFIIILYLNCLICFKFYLFISFIYFHFIILLFFCFTIFSER